MVVRAFSGIQRSIGEPVAGEESDCLAEFPGGDQWIFRVQQRQCD